MGGFRAKDADRDRYVEVIEAAYADGQLGDADRELRISRALTAETLDELQTLTRDLQNRPVPVTPVPGGDSTGSVSEAPVPGRASPVVPKPLGTALVGAVVLVVGLVGLAAMPDTGPDLGPGPGSWSEEWSEEWSESVPADSSDVRVEARSFEMTAAQVRRFLRSYEQRFDTLEAYEAGFYPARVGVQVPVRGSRPRMERWTWDGAWRQDSEASRVPGPAGVVDLGALDVRRLFANIETARRTLDVQRGRLSHVLVDTWTDGVPTVDIHVSNSYGESGYLKTTMSGDLLRAYPYES